MKTKQIFIFTILFAGFIIFASMRPENIPDNFHNFSINDTIDSLKNKTNTTISFDNIDFTSEYKRDRDSVKQVLAEQEQKLAEKKAELERKIQRLDSLTNITQSKTDELEKLTEECKKLKAEYKALGGKDFQK